MTSAVRIPETTNSFPESHANKKLSNPTFLRNEKKKEAIKSVKKNQIWGRNVGW